MEEQIITKTKEGHLYKTWAEFVAKTETKFAQTQFTPEAYWLLSFRKRQFVPILNKKLAAKELESCLPEFNEFYKNCSNDEKFGTQEGKDLLKKMEEFLPHLEKYFATKMFVAKLKKFKEEKNINELKETIAPAKTPSDELAGKHAKPNFFTKRKAAIFLPITLILVFLIYWQLFAPDLFDKDKYLFSQSNQKCAQFAADSFCNAKKVEVDGQTFSCLWNIKEQKCTVWWTK